MKEIRWNYFLHVEIKDLRNKLSAMGIVVANDEMINMVLNRLLRSYLSFTRTIAGRELPPTFEALEVRQLQEVINLPNLQACENDAEVLMVKTFNKGGLRKPPAGRAFKRRPRPRSCNGCSKPCHWERECP